MVALADEEHAERFPLDWRQRSTPSRHQKRARNWRKLVVGERLANKLGETTDWVLLAPPYRYKRRWGTPSFVEVKCLGCGDRFERRLDTIVRGMSRRCVGCYRRSVKATP